MYSIGDTVWVTRVGNLPIKTTCPICFGKLTVKLILGDDTECIVPCSYCGLGHEGPRGYIDEYDFTADAENFHITGLTVTRTAEGDEVEYHSGSDICYRTAKDVFETKEAALEEAQTVKKQCEIDKITRSEYIKKDKQKSFAWNAGYHLKHAEKMRKDIKYHEKMAVICNDRSKKEVKDESKTNPDVSGVDE
jgi:hypothetical protein